MQNQKPTNTMMQDPRPISQVVSIAKYTCSVCGKDMKSQGFFESLECENGHKIGTLTDDGIPIKATVVKDTPQ